MANLRRVTLSYSAPSGYRGASTVLQDTAFLEELPRQGDKFTHDTHGVSYRVSDVEWIYGRGYFDEENEPHRLPTEIVLHLVPR